MKTLSVLLACALLLVAHALSVWLKPAAVPPARRGPAAVRASGLVSPVPVHPETPAARHEEIKVANEASEKF